MRLVGFMAICLWLVIDSDAAPAQVMSYDCSWTAPARVTGCEPADDAISELLHAAGVHQVASHFGPDDATWRRMQAAVNRARATLDRARLSQRERIVAQNAGLRIARTVASYAASHDSNLARDLLRGSSQLVAWLALEPGQLHTADADQETVHWLGPQARWIEERLQDDPALLHESVYFHTRAFRMVRVGDRHFIFSQLVALDTAWRPHVTPVIGDIEMRSDIDRRACIAEFEPALARCGAPAGLRTLDRPPLIHLGGYVEVDADSRANCGSCHGTGQVLGRAILDLRPAEVPRYLARRRSALLALLQEHLTPIRAAAGAPP
jgi:hypothetical protein